MIIALFALQAAIFTLQCVAFKNQGLNQRLGGISIWGCAPSLLLMVIILVLNGRS